MLDAAHAPIGEAVLSDMDRRKKERAEINDAALKVQTAPDDETKKIAVDELWLKVESSIESFLRERAKENTKDIVQEFYTKLSYVACKWRSEEGDFLSYCFTAVRNSFLTYLEKKRTYSRYKDKFEDSVRGNVAEPDGSYFTENNFSIEDKIAIGQIKSKILGWIRGGYISPVEGMAVVLKYGLGKDMVIAILSDFDGRAKEGPRADNFKKLRNLNLDNIDFDSGMVDMKIASLLRKRNGSVEEFVNGALNKIKVQLRVE